MIRSGMNGIEINGLYCDRYELAMAQAYWQAGRAEEPAVFDYFFRKCPFGGGYVVFAGLETLLEALEGFQFEEEHLAYLEEAGLERGFLDWLGSFSFGGQIYAPYEGELVFPVEPILRVKGGLLETQIVETLVLNVLNFQSLIATKASRCRKSAGTRGLSEFGLRRAQGIGGMWASRAACIGGFDSTSNCLAGQQYGLKITGTMAHAFVQSYDDELAAFRAFAETHGSGSVLLLDTYDTLKSGLPNAIQTGRELRERGQGLMGVRLDSGDLAYLAKQVRARLDEAGFEEVKIVASNQLDEHIIRSLVEQGAPIDLFGVGTALAVGQPDGALDGVYKLARAGGTDRLKSSETEEKATLPGEKAVSRYYDSDGLLAADCIHFANEEAPARMIHPHQSNRNADLRNLTSRPLLEAVFRDGQRRQERRAVEAIRSYHEEAIQRLPPEYQRFENPHFYKVGLSARLREHCAELLKAL